MAERPAATRSAVDRDRRAFLAGSAALLAAGSQASNGLLAGAASEQVNLAAVGVGGKGWSDINNTSAGHNVVAFCDVETNVLKRRGRARRGGFAAAAKQWPKARRYHDWRVMLDREHKQIDGLTISTPDHMHAPITMSAMQLGIDTYTQKPLSRTVHEARQLTLAARKHDVVTQMGNQGHSGVEYRSLVEMIRGGVIGKIREAHAWSNRPIWPQGIQRPTGGQAATAGFHWDLWLGVARQRPFVPAVYHPFNWRGWFDFGAGALGDMGCHIIDPVVWSLELESPLSVTYSGPKPMAETFPEQERIAYRFRGTRWTAEPRLSVVWYDGGQLPDAKLAPLPAGEKLPTNGTLFIGEKGTLLTRHGGPPRLLPEEKFADYELPKLKPVDHYLQWTHAIRGAGRTTSHFDYAGPLTETVLLGTIAARFANQELVWDSQRLEFSNFAQANRYVRQEYRQGWQVDGL